MGLFSRSKDDRPDGKARDKAAKRGVAVDGASFVAHEGGTSPATVVVWPDRVEVHRHGDIGSLTRKGSGTQVIPVQGITSVSQSRDGLYSVVSIVAGASVTEFRTDVKQGPQLQQAVQDAMG